MTERDVGRKNEGRGDRMRRGASVALLLALATGVSGCASGGSMLNSIGLGSSSEPQQPLVGTPNPSPVAAATAPGAPPAPGDIDPKIDCPQVSVRVGTSTYTVNAPGADPNVLDVRYQGTIEKTARECAVLGATMTMKVGVLGRVIVGPAGGPGSLTVPIRIAVVKEGPQPQTIISKFYAQPVTIGPGQGNVPFTYVDSDVTFPTPSQAAIQSYIVYVGFDPKGEAPRKPRARRRRR